MDHQYKENGARNMCSNFDFEDFEKSVAVSVYEIYQGIAVKFY